MFRRVPNSTAHGATRARPSIADFNGAWYSVLLPQENSNLKNYYTTIPYMSLMVWTKRPYFQYFCIRLYVQT